MSFIRKMFGMASFEELKQSADDLYDQGKYGEAYLQYQKSKERAKQADPDILSVISERLDACRNKIALSRITKGIELLEYGDVSMAISEFENAIDTAASDEIVQQAKQHIETAEQKQDETEKIETGPMTDEERLVLISGNWEDEQAQEYELYGTDLQTALLLLDDNRVKEAREIVEALLERAQDPHYLYFEVGKCRIMDDDIEKGREALETFLTRIGPDEGGDTRLSVHRVLAGLADDADDPEGAIGHLENALKALPNDPRPYLMMGNFFRQKELHDEAIDVLQSGISMLNSNDMHPEWRLFQELGLTYLALGESDKAIEYLEMVIEILVERQHLDLPPETTIHLADLYESKDNKARAADLYSMLAQGSDSEHHFLYYYHAGRLLADIGLDDQAHRMLQRADPITPEDDPIKAEIASRLSALKNTTPKESNQ